MFTTFSGHNNS